MLTIYIFIQFYEGLIQANVPRREFFLQNSHNFFGIIFFFFLIKSFCGSEPVESDLNQKCNIVKI